MRVEHRGVLAFEGAYGTTRREDGLPVFVDTRFDLASLTKIVLSSVALAHAARGSIELDATLTDLVPEWRGTAHAPITLRMILAHDAGFASGADYRGLLESGVRVEEYALTRELVAAPREKVIYSDLGFISLGVILERLCSRSLQAIVVETMAANRRSLARFSAATRASGIAFPRQSGRSGAASCKAPCTTRRRTSWAESRDMPGCSVTRATSHALRRSIWARCAVAMLRRSSLDLVRESLTEQAFDPIARRGLGWVLRTSDENSCGTKMGSRAFGHTGFTGTSLWCDPDLDVSVTLLTNAVHYERGDLRALRAAACDEAVDFVERCARSV